MDTADRPTGLAGHPGVIAAAAAIAIDALTIGAGYLMLPSIAAQLKTPGPSNIALIGGAYLLLCTGVLIGRLAARPLRADRPAGAPAAPVRIRPVGCSAWFALPFALFVTAMLTESSGALEENTHFGRLFLGESGTGGPLVPVFILAFIVVLALFPLVSLLPLRPALHRGSPLYYAAQAVAVLAINAMVLVTTAYWEVQLAGTEPLDVALGGKILVFLASYIVFLLFYAPPRMALAEVAGGTAARVSFLVLLAVSVWRLLA